MVPFLRTPLGALVGVTLLAFALATGALGYQVYQVVHPRPTAGGSEGVAGGLLDHTEVAFKSIDGVRLGGWWVEGEPGAPAIVLAHDVGESRSALLNLAIALRKRGYSILMFDIRGHGRSAPAPCTFGVREKRDVLGALDFAASRATGGKTPLGVYGAGMGAQAAALAAADRPAATVLVLDGLYPDAGWPLVRRTFSRWPFAVRRLGFAARACFALLTGASADAERAADALPRLGRRSILLVAPAGDAPLGEAMQGIYESVPQRKDLETNLITLPATHASGLRGAEGILYHERVADFFASRLLR